MWGQTAHVSQFFDGYLCSTGEQWKRSLESWLSIVHFPLFHACVVYLFLPASSTLFPHQSKRCTVILESQLILLATVSYHPWFEYGLPGVSFWVLSLQLDWLRYGERTEGLTCSLLYHWATSLAPFVCLGILKVSVQLTWNSALAQAGPSWPPSLLVSFRLQTPAVVSCIYYVVLCSKWITTLHLMSRWVICYKCVWIGNVG